MSILDILGKIGFDWQVALANLINFLIIAWLLKKYAWKPLQEGIAKRQAAIDEGLNKASQAEAALMQAKDEQATIVKEAKMQANHIVATAKETADAMVEKAVTEAKTAAEQTAKAEEAKRAKAEQEFEQKLRERGAEFISSGVSKILGAKVDVATDKDFTKSVVDAM